MSVLAPPAANAHVINRDFTHYRSSSDQNQVVVYSSSSSSSSSSSNHYLPPVPRSYGFDTAVSKKFTNRSSSSSLKAFWPDLSSHPTSIGMEPINDLEQFDQILEKAQELSQPVVVDWMAAWCRKCIYLKPKLEKLAVEFDSKSKFYYVDVNKVPQTLVKRGNVSKMPTIQLWKDGEMKEEVIGGHKAWLVIEEVREMIRKYV